MQDGKAETGLFIGVLKREPDTMIGRLRRGKKVGRGMSEERRGEGQGEEDNDRKGEEESRREKLTCSNGGRR